MVGKRSSVEIIYEILQMDGKKKTSIMYATALTHPQIMRYLEVLIERGLIVRTAGPAGCVYRVTPRGKDLTSHLAVVFDCLRPGEFDAA